MSYGPENEAFAKKMGVAPGVLRDATIVVELPMSQAGRKDGPAAFVLAANLLVRLFHRVHLVGPDAPLGAHPWKIATTREAWPILGALSEGTVVWGTPDRAADVAVGIGAPPSTPATRSVVVGFGPGVASIDRDSSDGGEDMLAALVAACFGAAQTFLHVATAAGAPLAPNAPFDFRLPTRAASDAVDLGMVHVVGVGAIGSATAYGLAHLPCRGTIVPIDHDIVDTSNLQRYVLMRRTDVPSPKVEVAARTIAGTTLSVKPFEGSYAQYKKEHPDVRVERLVTAVDSPAGRRRLAESLPRRIINASTTDRVITVSRHAFGDGRACLYCLYADRGRAPTQEELLARELGVDKDEVEQLLSENAPVDSDFVRRVEAHLKVPVGTHAAWIGTPLASFHRRAVCGTAAVATNDGKIVAPLAFISAAAGLLLLAELVAGASLGDEATRPNYLRMDMLGSPAHADREDRTPDPTHACICKDVDYLATYRRRYE